MNQSKSKLKLLRSRKNRLKSKKTCKSCHMDWNTKSKRCNKSKSKKI